ncbi:MAG TPA: hypothetical protein PLF87_09720 [Syntrophorhabdaceae bacterium]|nr:hypothetical protein [Syntrophorhabdaceae bacterium]HOG39245.1 hypothetical protein [Syntrophorhabdaceae bacterium]HQM77473.1 hypothetical protein [Syntrophorhabdaceae bacterium]
MEKDRGLGKAKDSRSEGFEDSRGREAKGSRSQGFEDSSGERQKTGDRR